MAILINDNTGRVQYTATASQTSFTVPYEFFDNADLKVYNNDVLLTYNASPSTASQYSVTGAGVTGGGSITLGGSGASVNDVIVIVRDITIQRTTDFPLAGPFNIESLNSDLDKITTLLQNLQTDLSRVLRLTDSDSPETLTALPTKANRENKFLSFDSDGQVSMSSGTGADSGLRTDLASSAASDGAALVNTTSGSSVQTVLNGKVSTFYAGSAPTATATGDLWFDTSENILYRWDGSDWDAAVADLTTNNQVFIADVDPVTIQADSTGTTTTDLPVTRTIKVYKGGVVQTSGVTIGTVTSTSGITATGSVASGTITISISAANAAGSITVPITFESITYYRHITVNRNVGAPVSGGGSGSTSFTDQTWTNISTTTDTQVTDSGALVQSDGSGQIRFIASAIYNGDVAVTIKAQYSTDGASWTDAATATGSTPINTPGEESPGFVAILGTTISSLTASTNYYVRLVAARNSGSGTISWAFPSFTATQP
jgi:hypothetical protein